MEIVVFFTALGFCVTAVMCCVVVAFIIAALILGFERMFGGK